MKISPDLPDTEIYWTFDPADFPAGPETKITWEPWDVKNNRPDVGVGSSPTLKVRYSSLYSKYDDYMPPDNRWFGQKKITVQVGNTTIIRPVWFFFLAEANRITRQGGKMEFAWFHYFKENGAVPNLAQFEFDIDLKDMGQHSKGKYTIGPLAYSYVPKSIFNANVVGDSYSEESYPPEEKYGVHNVAKICKHELWHGIVKNETAKSWWGLGNGLGHPDDDGDRLSDAREADFGTNPNERDTCGISRYDPTYSHYARYGDQELFCRVQQDGVLGDASKDWSFGGTQYPKE